MLEFWQDLFSSDFMSHGHCYRWEPAIVWLHAISDGLIALSYYFIPLMLVYLVRKRRDLPFHWVFLMFGVFILSCGTTHAMEIWTLWNGTYRLAGVIKAITALSSLATAIVLVPLVPKALQLPSPAQLRAANQDLEKEIAERRRIEDVLEVERNFIAAVLNTVSTAIVVLDLKGRVVQCNWACESFSGCQHGALINKHLSALFSVPEESERFQTLLQQIPGDLKPETFEAPWSDRNGGSRLISWSTTNLADGSGQIAHIIAAGVDVTESRRLEKTILDISGREQARIGQDLHDGLGQHLTGIAFMSRVLEDKLAARLQDEAADATNIVRLVNEAISKTRELSRGLLPVGSDASGLMLAMSRWAEEVEAQFGITCRFQCDHSILIYDENVATHLYRIAQEAVNNAIKHASPSEIDILLANSAEGIVLSISDNGVGLPDNLRSSKGLGLQIMSFRARMINGTLGIKRSSKGGTIVSCRVQADAGAILSNGVGSA